MNERRAYEIVGWLLRVVTGSFGNGLERDVVIEELVKVGFLKVENGTVVLTQAGKRMVGYDRRTDNVETE